MPGYKGHLIGAVIIYASIIMLCSLYTLSYLQLAEWLLCILLGGLFPDIDTKSKGQSIFYYLLVAILIILALKRRWCAAGILATTGLLPLLTRHRGLFHKLWFILILVIILGAILIYYRCAASARVVYDSTFFLVGVIGHLLLDGGFKQLLRR